MCWASRTSATTRKLTVLHLEREGYPCHVAATGAAAREGWTSVREELQGRQDGGRIGAAKPLHSGRRYSKMRHAFVEEELWP